MAEAATPASLITRMENGKNVDVPINEAWDSMCKIMRIARMLTNGGDYQRDEHLYARLAFLAERMSDLEGMTFRYRRSPYGANLEDLFVPIKAPFSEVINPVRNPDKK